MARWNHVVLFGDGLAKETAIDKDMRNKNKINNIYPYHVSFRILISTDSEYYFSENILDLDRKRLANRFVYAARITK